MVPEGHLKYVKLSVESPENSDQGICFRAYAPWEEHMSDYLDRVTITTRRSGVASRSEDIFSKTPDTLKKIIDTINSSSDYNV